MQPNSTRPRSGAHHALISDNKHISCFETLRESDHHSTLTSPLSPRFPNGSVNNLYNKSCVWSLQLHAVDLFGKRTVLSLVMGTKTSEFALVPNEMR